MVALCCTKGLLKRIGARPVSHAGSTTCALGNWVAKVIYVRSQPVVIAVSERAFIPVLFPARGLQKSLVPGFLEAVTSLLLRIGAPKSIVERELALMTPTVIAPTNSRQVLGVMNQYAAEVPLLVDDRPSVSLPEIELHLATGVVGPLGLFTPQAVALEFLQTLHAVM